MSRLKPIRPAGLQYNHIIGTGGVGSGIFFSIQDNHTLGRNESRMAALEPYNDFCKQHIILHYIAVLLKHGTTDTFELYPIAKVGNDTTGKQLIQQMQQAGMNTAAVDICKERSTLFSVCFQYPDGSGGNITSENSASSRVSPIDIARFFEQYQFDGKTAVVLAVPEVPVETRIALLKAGKRNQSLAVASLLSSEANAFEQQDGFHLTDILAVNLCLSGCFIWGFEKVYHALRPLSVGRLTFFYYAIAIGILWAFPPSMPVQHQYASFSKPYIFHLLFYRMR